jgi:hypothetical protein
MYEKHRQPLSYSRLVSHFEGRLRHACRSELTISAIEYGVLCHRAPTGEKDSIALYLNAALSHDIINAFATNFVHIVRNCLSAELGSGAKEEDDPFSLKKYSGGRAAIRAKIAPSISPGLMSTGGRLELLKSLWDFAPPPDARGLATLMLLAKGVTDTGLSISDIISRLNHPRTIVIVTCPVQGFVDELSLLVRKGFVLPGKTELVCASDMDARRQLEHARGRTKGRTVLAVTDVRSASCLSRSVGDLLRLELPLVYLAKDPSEVPEQLRLTANLEINCGWLSKEIIQHLIISVCEEEPTESLKRLPWTLLELDDVSLALRRGNTPSVVAALLKRLTDARLRYDEPSKPASVGEHRPSVAVRRLDYASQLPAEIRIPSEQNDPRREPT